MSLGCVDTGTHLKVTGLLDTQKKHVNVFKWASQGPGTNSTNSLWKDLKVDVHRHCVLNLNETLLIC